MAKDNKTATYRTGKGGEAVTTVTDKQVKQLADAGRLVAVRRNRIRGL
jgi:hypothetical protein